MINFYNQEETPDVTPETPVESPKTEETPVGTPATEEPGKAAE